MLFSSARPLNDVSQVKSEIKKIIARQKRGSKDDLSAFQGEIDELVSALAEFYPEWKKLPAVFRVTRVKNNANIAAVYKENLLLPDVKHDLELVLKMLNHMRKGKGLPEVKVPLFVQPDEITLAQKEGKSDVAPGEIISQMAVVFQKGAVMWIGFVFGRDYVLLQGR
ncbi:hypothetical protein NTE_02900 [Candidatus Nitrososphaera evergladensis SR1]|uniref:Uncharacterized protein n=2 Tax=Nitrososphaera TaxID=497726 RepID=A0A075MUU5_9ARCH|nr:hypothetical protein NTE_02900 [Candidatus Nitrososphaera evergladensis SR1]